MSGRTGCFPQNTAAGGVPRWPLSLSEAHQAFPCPQGLVIPEDSGSAGSSGAWELVHSEVPRDFCQTGPRNTDIMDGREFSDGEVCKCNSTNTRDTRNISQVLEIVVDRGKPWKISEKGSKQICT